MQMAAATTMSVHLISEGLEFCRESVPQLQAVIYTHSWPVYEKEQALKLGYWEPV